MGLEPMTSSLPRTRSTTELQQRASLGPARVAAHTRQTHNSWQTADIPSLARSSRRSPTSIRLPGLVSNAQGNRRWAPTVGGQSARFRRMTAMSPANTTITIVSAIAYNFIRAVRSGWKPCWTDDLTVYRTPIRRCQDALISVFAARWNVREMAARDQPPAPPSRTPLRLCYAFDESPEATSIFTGEHAR